MGFSTQNGWIGPPATRDYPVPGTSVVLTLNADSDVGTILVWCCAQWAKLIEPLDPGQCGGLDIRTIAGSATMSNHASGTAVDLNSAKHPQHAYTFSDDMKAQIHWIITQTKGCVRWGGDWTPDSVDEMHIEIDTVDGSLLSQVAANLRSANPEYGSVSPVTSSSGMPGTIGTAASSVDLTVKTIQNYPKRALTTIGNKNPVNSEGRLGAIRLGGQQYVTAVTAVTTSAVMSYASNSVGYLSLTLQDDEKASLLRSGYVAIGVPMSYGDQRMDIRTIEAVDGKGGPELRLEARSRTLFRLRTGQQVGAGSWGQVNTGDWLKARAAEVGARTVIQPDLYDLVITRGDGEGTWDVMQKLADVHEAWCFEYEQTLVFGQPTWLAGKKNSRAWVIRWNGYHSYTTGLAGMPQYRATADATDPAAVETLTLSLWHETAFRMRPGDLIEYSGAVGDAVGYWIVNKVDLDLGGALRVLARVTAQRVINPPSKTVLSDASTVAAGNYGQTGAVTPNATTAAGNPTAAAP